MTRLAILLVLVVTFTLALLWATQRRLIYFPDPRVPSPRDVGLAGAEPVSFATADGLSLSGWFVPPRARATGDTVIVFNGNGGNRAYRAPLAASLASAGMATFLFDYRGYGENPGSPSEAGLLRDARAARACVLARRGVARDRLVYFGESLGTGVAVALAGEHPPRALVLRSPFTSLADVGAHHYPLMPVGWLLRDRFESLARIDRVSCPLLVVAGDRDTIVPFDQSRRVFEAAREPKRFVVMSGAGHNDPELLAGRKLVTAVTEFLASRHGPS